MPFLHGSDTQVLMDGLDISGWLRQAEMEASVDPADTTVFQKAWKTFIAGPADGKLTFQGLHDVARQEMRATLQAAANSVVSLSPGAGTAFGDMTRLISPDSASYKESSPLGDVVKFDWQLGTDGPIGFGNLMHPLGLETVTGTSTFLDGGAQSLTGALAHLHVTAISGAGAQVTVKFQDATTSGGAYADIASGAFTLQNAIGAQRLVIPGTIRQFVKCVWTIAGTTPNITFAVGFARTF